jgi:hypothetical protein
MVYTHLDTPCTHVHRIIHRAVSVGIYIAGTQAAVCVVSNDMSKGKLGLVCVRSESTSGIGLGCGYPLSHGGVPEHLQGCMDVLLVLKLW